MKLEEIVEYVELLDEAENFKPFVKKIIEVIKSYSGEFKDLVDPLGDYIRDSRVKSIAFYASKGFTRNESILLSMHDSFAIKEMMKSIGDNKK